MSLPLIARAWASGTPPIDRIVLVALADWANEAGKCWPSMPTIASKTGVDVRTARRVMARLETGGHLSTERRPGKGILYTVHPGQPDPGHAVPGQPVPRTESTLTPDTLSPNTPKTTIERKKTTSSPSTRAARNAIEALPDLPTGASEQQWADYVEMRVAMARADKKRPWTATTARKAIEKLHTLAAVGNDPGAVLDQSVLNTWQGLFPVKDNHDGRRGQSVAASRGNRPDPALDMRRRALAELEAEERAASREAGDSRPWLALPPGGSG